MQATDWVAHGVTQTVLEKAHCSRCVQGFCGSHLYKGSIPGTGFPKSLPRFNRNDSHNCLPQEANTTPH